MNTYIVFDLEWNQSTTGQEGTVKTLPFEIIEIGAVKLDENMNIIDSFDRLVRPVLYPSLHFKVREIVNITDNELRRNGVSFKRAAGEFIRWCYNIDEEGNRRDEPTFCTWGDMDLEQLQRNLNYYRIKVPFAYPLLFYDVQKLYNLAIDGAKGKQLPLEKAVDELNIDIDGEFHRANDDALFTARVLEKLDMNKVGAYRSLDYFTLPKAQDDQIYLEFPDYVKFVSRPFDTREELMADKTVTDVACPVCRRLLKKRIKWFSANQKQHHCIAICPEHGFVKGKIRVKHTLDERVFAVKTIKLVSSEVAASYSIRRDEILKVQNMKRKLYHK